MQAPALSSLSATKQFESIKAQNIINKIVIQILDSRAIIQNENRSMQCVGCHERDYILTSMSV